jgi:hypothetical protein
MQAPEADLSIPLRSTPDAQTAAATGVSTFGQAGWVILVIAVALASFAWGTELWQGVVRTMLGDLVPEAPTCAGGGCFFMGMFGLLSFALYPISLVALWTALGQPMAERNIARRAGALFFLAFCLSTARVAGVYFAVAVA